MFRLLHLVFGLLLLSAALTVSAIGIGGSQPPPSALVGLDACGLPCWNQIVPRRTSFDAAQAQLLEDGYRLTSNGQTFTFEPSAIDRDCQVWLKIGDGLVTVTSLVGCPGVRVGDVIAILGEPEGILRSLSGLVFRGGQILVLVHEFACDEWFAPETEVRSIYFADGAAMRVHNHLTTDPVFLSFQWRGFASRASYREQEEDFPVCS